MDITIHGSGYVGLVTGACLAEMGHRVVCVDIDEARVALLVQGIVPIFEPGLEEMVRRHLAVGKLSFSTDAAMGVKHGLLQLVAVGTPAADDGSADLRYVRSVAATVGAHMQDYRLVCIKSTVPVGTCDMVRQVIRERLADRETDIPFDVASNPEFLKEGAAVRDFMGPDRVIVGTDSARATEILRELYAPLTRNHEVMLVMDVRSSELTKYAANAMLATRISFMNEMANIAERVGANIERVRLGIGSDPRIGYHFLYAGCGYGGSCFPKDVSAIVRAAEERGYTPQLLQAVMEVNDRQKHLLFEKIRAHYGGMLTGKVIAVWGLAFKPNTDDMRDAPSRALMAKLWSTGAIVRAYDPIAMRATQQIYGARDDLWLCGTKEEALRTADALAILTDALEFRTPDFPLVRRTLRDGVVFDGRNLYDPQHVAREGLKYYGIGTGSIPGMEAPVEAMQEQAVGKEEAVGVGS